MKPLIALLVLTVAGVAHAGDTNTLFDGRLTFVLPDGFAVMPSAIAEAKYPVTNRPKYIYSNTNSTTSVAVDTMEATLTDAELPEFRDFLENTMTRMIPGCRILTRDFVTLNGTRWGRLEFQSNAVDTDIHNILLMTALDGQPVMFNFNSTKEEFPKVKDALVTSINTIRIGDGSSN